MTGNKRRRGWVWVAIVMVAALLLAVLVTWRYVSREIELPPPSSTASARTVVLEDFVGAETCEPCHLIRYAAWRRSTHGRAGGSPGPEWVIARFDGTPIRFADAVVTPAVMRDGRYVFTVEREGRESESFTVLGVIGGGHMVGGGTQGFVSEFPDGTIRFLPFDFIRRENVWFCNTNQRADKGWVAITPNMTLAECADWPPSRILGTDPQYATCQECHGSQIQLRYDTSAMRYVTEFKSLAINCESCHGPGRLHVELARSGRISQDENIGMRALQTLSEDASLEICFQCHAVKDALEPGYLPGRPLEAHYSLGLPMLGERPLYPDGRVRTFAYQVNHRYSDCYLNGSMTCVDCHDPHSQGYRDVWGAVLESRFSDGQCLACHASKAQRPEEHTHHPVESPGGRCVSCHMPYLQQPGLGRALRYARSDHTIPIPRPSFDDQMGVENACSQCHAGRPVAELQVQTDEWYGDLKPHKDIVSAIFGVRELPDAQAAVDPLLDAEARHPMAQLAALGLFVQRYLRPDMQTLEEPTVAALRRLAENGDLDLRSVALATLHLTRGNDRRTRAFLARALDTAGDVKQALRARWATTIAAFGDRYLAAGDLDWAVVAYQKALEIRPDHPGILMNLGVAHTHRRAYDTAVSTLRRSLELDSHRPIGWVNLGVALEGQGDIEGAEAAYRRAIDVKSDEALAYFNLGNLHLQRDVYGEAIPLYERAVELNPSNKRAHAYLARAYVGLGDYRRALAAAQRGARFAPDDPGMRELVEELEKAARQ